MKANRSEILIISYDNLVRFLLSHLVKNESINIMKYMAKLYNHGESIMTLQDPFIDSILAKLCEQNPNVAMIFIRNGFKLIPLWDMDKDEIDELEKSQISLDIA